MLFRNLQSSTSLELVRYADIDQFRVSERYARAESVPLRSGQFSVLRASLALPASTLSLVRTFPRIIKGYDFAGRLVIVVPMDEIGSTRVNGKDVGRSLIVFKGDANCTVYEPEARIVAILSIKRDELAENWLALDDGHLLLRLPELALDRLRMHVRGILETAAAHPEAIRAEGAPETIETALFSAFQEAMSAGHVDRSNARSRYKTIVDQIERVVTSNQTTNIYCDTLAKEIGISARTMQNAVHAVCGTSPLRYSQLNRLWAVRRQLRNGTPGLTIKASAYAHGFWHMGDFSKLYHDMIGELPSQTLANARRLLA
ncbi:helix-turn-helix domain-containing protein [Bradyrhizobium sp. WYCCWR 13023]|uniref:Helix-turn-helix domain-containing protein n=1 Tax=Bradyrhizobium zhengyangense TaxID=2911009 RepID=A0A9X1UDL6_9BRAD|nr:helix-turn-helix domain-containing protein [Bradyrhizobium zhengyangense]MCG2631544.1 helix-turn-helix domain-containing protein [Bradyrhizobium zhengyangense]